MIRAELLLAVCLFLAERQYSNTVVCALSLKQTGRNGVTLMADPSRYAFSLSSPLPPSPVTLEKKKDVEGQQAMPTGSCTKQLKLPECVPQLSELLRDATIDDFCADSNDGMMISKLEETTNGNIVSNNTTLEKVSLGREKKTRKVKGSGTPSNNETRKPWRASFYVSKKTQKRIQGAALMNSGIRRNRMERASSVLKTLLGTPPHRCNAANVVCALTLSAKVLGTNTKATPEFRSLLFQTLDILNELVHEKCLNARQLCNVAWAIAKHYDRDENILPQSPQLAALSSENIFGVAETWDLQEANVETSAQRVDKTVDEIARQLTELFRSEIVDEDSETPRAEAKVGEICMASWAYGILRPRRRPPGWQMPPQMGELPKEEAKSSSKLQNLITFEKWGQSPEDNSVENLVVESEDLTDALFDAVGDALCSQPAEDNRFSNPTDEGLMRVQTCTWNELANVAWAFATHGRCRSSTSEQLLMSLSREAVGRLRFGGPETQDMQSRDIAQLVWALGTVQSDNFRLAEDLVELVEAISTYIGLGQSDIVSDRPFKSWSCPDIVQVVISLAHARIDHLPLLRSLYEEAGYRLSLGIFSSTNHGERRMSFLAWEVSVLLWAQARLYLKHPQGKVFEHFSEIAPKALNLAMGTGCGLQQLGIGPQEQANIAWSLTIIEQHQSKEAVTLLDSIFRDSARSCKKEGLIQLEHAHQLWQALFLLEEESPEAVKNVPSWFRDYLRDKWSAEKAREKISSARHRSLSQTLNLMGVAHYNEHDEDIDVAIVLKGTASWTHQTERNTQDKERTIKVAVEFDGPNHFTRLSALPLDTEPVGKQVRALGHTVLKYRLLKKQGWTVIRVPYYEFDKIPFWASMERQRYLQRLLKTHANISFSDTDISEYKSLSPNRISRFD